VVAAYYKYELIIMYLSTEWKKDVTLFSPFYFS